jgi:hypothetical protein
VASEERQKPEHPRSGVYEWEDKIVMLGYTGSPYPDTPWEIERGSLEARAGMFVLTEVSDLGIMASKLARSVEEKNRIQVYLDDPIFIPWASVHSIRLLEPPNDSSGSDENRDE